MIVGTAEVVVRADTAQFKDDLRSSFADSEGEADAAGSSAGGRFGKAFNEGSQGELGSPDFSQLEADAESAGAGGGGRFRSAFGRNAQLGPELGGSFDSIVRDADRAGKEAGDGLEQGISRGAQNAADDVKKEFSNGGNDVTKSFSDISFPDIGSGLALKIAAIIPLVGVLGGGLSALVGALAAVAAAAAFAAGALAILATGIAGLALGGLTAFLAFSGIAKAVTAMGTAQSKAGAAGISAAKQEQQAADQIHAATERVAQAKESLANAEYALQQARHSAAEEAVRDEHDVEEAEYSLAQAHKAVRDAQAALSQAYVDAKNKLADLQIQERGAAIGEAQAQLRLKEARAAYQAVLNNPAATAEQRQQALLDLESAENDLDSAKQNRKEITQETDKANKAGVNGSEEVKSAKQKAADATHHLKDAEFTLAQARQKQADDQVQEAHSIQQAMLGVKNAAQSLADAQHALKEAQDPANQSLGAGASAANNAALALAKLSPQAQKFAKYLFSLKPKLDELKNAAGSRLFGPLTKDLHALINNFFPALLGAVKRTGAGLADFFGEITKALDSNQITSALTNLSKDFNKVDPKSGLTSWETFGRIVGNILKAIAGLAQAAFPTFQRFIRFVDNITGSFADKFKGAKNLQHMTDLINKMGTAAAQFGHLFGAIFRVIGAFIDDAHKKGQGFVVEMTGAINRFADFLGSAKGKNQVKKYFDDIKPVVVAVTDFIGGLIKAFIKLGQNKDLGKIFKSLTDALPGLADGIKSFTNTVAPAMIKIIKDIIKIVSNLANDGGLKTFAVAIGSIIVGIGKLFKVITGGPQGKILGPIIGGFAALVVAVVAAKKVYKGYKAVVDAVKVAQVFLNNSTIGLGIQSVLLRAKIIAVEAAQKAWALVTRGLAAAQEALGIAMDAALGPVGLIIIGVAALVAGIILAYKHSKTFRDIVDAIGRALKAVGIFIKNVAVKAFDFLKSHLQLLLLAFGPLGVAILAVVEVFKHWDAIRKFVGKVIGAVINFFKKLPGEILKYLKLIITHLAKWYVDFYKYLFTKAYDVIKAVIGFFTNLVKKIGGALGDVISKVSTFIGNFVSGFQTKISNIISKVIGFFSDLGKKVWSTLQDLMTKVRTFVSDLFGAFERKVSKICSDVISFFQAIPGKVANAFTNVMTKVGNFVSNLTSGFKAKVNNIVDAVVGFFTALPGRLANVGTRLLNAAKGLATSIANGIKNGIQSAITTVVGWVGGLGGKLVSIATTVGSKAASVGKAIWGGIKSGLLGAIHGGVDIAKEIYNALAKFINSNFIDKIKGIGIHIHKFGLHLDVDPFKSFPDLPIIPAATGATFAPRPGGTIVRLAEAGRAESVVDTGLINRRLRDDESRTDNVVSELQKVRSILQNIARLGGINIEQLLVQAHPDEKAEESVPRSLRQVAFELGA